MQLNTMIPCFTYFLTLFSPFKGPIYNSQLPSLKYGAVFTPFSVLSWNPCYLLFHVTVLREGEDPNAVTQGRQAGWGTKVRLLMEGQNQVIQKYSSKQKVRQSIIQLRKNMWKKAEADIGGHWSKHAQVKHGKDTGEEHVNPTKTSHSTKTIYTHTSANEGMN